MKGIRQMYMKNWKTAFGMNDAISSSVHRAMLFNFSKPAKRMKKGNYSSKKDIIMRKSHLIISLKLGFSLSIKTIKIKLTKIMCPKQ